MTRKYKLERLQKNILLGVSGAALASTVFFSGINIPQNNIANNDTIFIESPNDIKNLNKAKKENTKLLHKKNYLDD